MSLTIQEFLQLLGAKEVDLYLARKQIAELEAKVANLLACSSVQKSVE